VSAGALFFETAGMSGGMKHGHDKNAASKAMWRFFCLFGI
jgi:hypothetical protein